MTVEIEAADLNRFGVTPAGSGPAVLSVAGLTEARLARAGAGYGVEQVRGWVAQLAEAGELTVRVVIADEATTPDELVDAATELARYAARWGVTADVEGASADELVAVGVAALRGVAPMDGLVALREAWRPLLQALPADAAWAREPLLRRLDDLPRRVVFEMLREAWLRTAPGWPGGYLTREAALARTTARLGEEGRWLKAFRQYTYDTVRRMVIIPTWQCELRCSYCYIPKQDGRVMPFETIERSVDLLLGTSRDEVMLQFFGGEALLEYERVQHAIAYSDRRAREAGKRISYVLSSNGWSLTKDKLDWLRQYPVRMELSLDGDEATQRRFRPPRVRGEDSYANSIATHAKDILASGLEQWVIMVVHPTQVERMPESFFHIADLGFRRIQINNMLGRPWTPEQMSSFARGLHTIGKELMRRWAAGEQLEFINMNHQPLAMRLNGEVTVDWDGTIYGGNAFLHETEHKQLFVVGHLDDHTNIDRYWIDATDNNFLLDWSYRPKVTANNVEVGKVMASFIKWMRGQGYGPAGKGEVARAPHGARPEGAGAP